MMLDQPTSHARRQPRRAPEPGAWGLPQVHLPPGQVVVTDEPHCLTTTLGSCVSVALFVPRGRFGALCHAMLPVARGLSAQGDPLRYVDEAVATMLAAARCNRIPDGALRAKIFGGAHLVEDGVDDHYQVGVQNVAAAEEQLATAGVVVVARDVGGRQGRRIHFNTATGEVLLWRVPRRCNC